VSVAILSRAPPRQTGRLLWIFLLASLVLHGMVLAMVSRVRPPMPSEKRAMELVMVEVAKPLPPPAVPPPSPAPSRRPAQKVFFRRPAAPPPPNGRPPPEPRQAEPPPVVVGLTLQSTTTAGTFSAPVGNTLAGKTAEQAPDPSAVRPAATPLYQVDNQPTVIGEVKIPYPEDARRQRLEGTVVLSVLVDETGRVRSVKVISGPGGGLDEAAARALELSRFRPATRKGQPVATQIRYLYTFQLND
jgi:periplasmic protein TonB